MFTESRVESAKALRWKEAGHVGGGAGRLEKLPAGSRGRAWDGKVVKVQWQRPDVADQQF